MLARVHVATAGSHESQRQPTLTTLQRITNNVSAAIMVLISTRFGVQHVSISDDNCTHAETDLWPCGSLTRQHSALLENELCTLLYETFCMRQSLSKEVRLHSSANKLYCILLGKARYSSETKFTLNLV